MIQYVGYHGGADRLILRGDPASPRWTACWLAGGRLAAVMAISSPRDLAQGRRLIEAAAAVDPARLADPQVPLRDAIAG